MIIATENLISIIMMFYIMDDYCIAFDFKNNDERIDMNPPATSSNVS